MIHKDLNRAITALSAAVPGSTTAGTRVLHAATGIEPAGRDYTLGFRLALAPGQPVQGGGATGSGATASATAVPAAGYSGEGGTTPPERPAAGRGFIQALRRWFKQ